MRTIGHKDSILGQSGLKGTAAAWTLIIGASIALSVIAAYARSIGSIIMTIGAGILGMLLDIATYITNHPFIVAVWVAVYMLYKIRKAIERLKVTK